jgi:hypothetical protein
MLGKPSQVPSAQNAPLAQQTEAGEPMQLQPTAKQTEPGAPMQGQQTAKASGLASWETMINNAFELSSQQNGGSPKTLRSCQPQSRVCTTGIMLKMNGTDAVLLSRQNIDGKIIEREICTFNNFGDMRSCVEWDTKATHRDMKDAKGEWSKVSD